MDRLLPLLMILPFPYVYTQLSWPQVDLLICPHQFTNVHLFTKVEPKLFAENSLRGCWNTHKVSFKIKPLNLIYQMQIKYNECMYRFTKKLPQIKNGSDYKNSQNLRVQSNLVETHTIKKPELIRPSKVNEALL